jgi:hypothetical protein
MIICKLAVIPADNSLQTEQQLTLLYNFYLKQNTLMMVLIFLKKYKNKNSMMLLIYVWEQADGLLTFIKS